MDLKPIRIYPSGDEEYNEAGGYYRRSDVDAALQARAREQEEEEELRGCTSLLRRFVERAEAAEADRSRLLRERDAVTMTLTECQSMANWERKQRTEAEAEVARLLAGLQQLRSEMRGYTAVPKGFLAGNVALRIDEWSDQLDALLAEVVPPSSTPKGQRR
jgi:hypothetical protein